MSCNNFRESFLSAQTCVNVFICPGKQKEWLLQVKDCYFERYPLIYLIQNHSLIALAEDVSHLLL